MRTYRLATVVGVLALCASLSHAQNVQGFSIVVLVGETQSSAQPQGLSSSAQKALSDIKEFLPYKGYRVIDTQWVAGSSFGVSNGRVRIDEKDHEFELVTFPSEIPETPGKSGMTRPLASARFTLRTPPEGYGPSGKGIGISTMLENSFAIKPGETVVVGTSRTQGTNALIVLLTAVQGKK